MRLATRRNGTRDGALMIVHPDGLRGTPAPSDIPHLQSALDDWKRAEPRLRQLCESLVTGSAPSQPLSPTDLLAPLPRAYEWVDGSAYLNHVRLVRKARGAEVPESLTRDPLVYQGGSGVLLGPTEPLRLADESWGLDFESEVCVILGDVAQGTTQTDAAGSVYLLMLANDVSLRNLIPTELAKGFGFFQSKPATAFSPFAITPDELGGAWKDGRVHLRLRTTLNGVQVGDAESGPEMHFSFFDLIAHLARTRSFTAGTILGSGTVSNADPARGISCLAERRTIETLEHGSPRTPFMKVGDRVQIEMFSSDRRSLFGQIDQRVVGT